MLFVHNFAQLLYLRPNILPSALFQTTSLYTKSEDLMSVITSCDILWSGRNLT